MNTLVYFASGLYKEQYQDLKFEKIYLIDKIFKTQREQKGKVICIKADCLKSISMLKRENVKINCFVAINEGLGEGGGDYAINSEMFLGYVMPLLNDSYIHIMNRSYYGKGRYKVSMDLPYSYVELTEEHPLYIAPSIFSNRHVGAKLYSMRKISTKTICFLNPKVQIQIIHDSIWNDYDKLDAVVLSYAVQGQGKFFNDDPKVISNNGDFQSILNHCISKNFTKIGFTPWLKGNYNGILKLLKILEVDSPIEIRLYHLNGKDYNFLKQKIATA